MAITTIQPEAHQLKLQTIMCCAAIKNGTGKTGVYAIPMRKAIFRSWYLPFQCVKDWANARVEDIAGIR